MMDILLIQPGFEDFYSTVIRHQPLGLMSIKAVLQQAGFEVGLFDFLNTRHKQTVVWPKEFQQLKEHYRDDDFSPAALYRNYYRFGRRDKELREVIEKERPRLIGISALFTGYLPEVIRLTRAIRNWAPQAAIVMGGHAVAADYQRIGHDYADTIDYLVYGEGEPACLGLANFLIRGIGRLEDIPNLYIPHLNGRAIQTQPRIDPDPDRIPFPDRHHLDYRIYQRGGRRMASMAVSRGCPYNCRFCSVHDVWGFEWRHRSIGSIVEEMRFLYESQLIGIFNFEDDNLSYRPEWFESLLDAIIARFPAGEIELLAMNGINFHTIPIELVPKLKQAGFRELNFSISTASHHRSRDWDRPASIDRFEPVLEALIRHRIEVTAYFIIGAPDQTPDEVMETIIYLCRQPVWLGPSIYYLTPGQPLAKTCGVEFPDNFNLYRSTACYPDRPEFTALDKITLLRLCRMVNLLKQSPLSNDDPLSERIRGWLNRFWEQGELSGFNRRGERVDFPYNRKLAAEFLAGMKLYPIRNPSGKLFSASSLIDH